MTHSVQFLCGSPIVFVVCWWCDDVNAVAAAVGSEYWPRSAVTVDCRVLDAGVDDGGCGSPRWRQRPPPAGTTAGRTRKRHVVTQPSASLPPFSSPPCPPSSTRSLRTTSPQVRTGGSVASQNSCREQTNSVCQCRLRDVVHTWGFYQSVFLSDFHWDRFAE